MLKIIAENLSKEYEQGKQKLIVINSVSETFEQSKTYAITGCSGSGKSTLLHLLAGIDNPTSGNVLFNNKAISSFSNKEKEKFFNKSVGLVFQLPYLIRELTVIENVIIKGLISGLSTKESKKTGMSLLEKTGLVEKANNFPGQLSGGQQQRVAILRAVFNKPKFLLADEPTGNLDEKTGQHIINFLLEYQKEFDMGLIVSSHDNYVTKKMEHIFELKEGKLSK